MSVSLQDLGPESMSSLPEFQSGSLSFPSTDISLLSFLDREGLILLFLFKSKGSLFLYCLNYAHSFLLLMTGRKELELELEGWHSHCEHQECSCFWLYLFELEPQCCFSISVGKSTRHDTHSPLGRSFPPAPAEPWENSWWYHMWLLIFWSTWLYPSIGQETHSRSPGRAFSCSGCPLPTLPRHPPCKGPCCYS